MDKITTIIFDFDGTLADTRELLFEVYNNLAPRLKTKVLSKKDIESLTKMNLQTISKELNFPLYKVPYMASKIIKGMKAHINRINLFPGITELLKSLKEKGYNLGILSSNSLKNIKSVLNAKGIDHFDYIHSKKDLFGKDQSLRKMMKKYKLTADEILYIGDEERDINACHKVNIKIAAVCWGYNHPDLLISARPSFLIRNTGELLALL